MVRCERSHASGPGRFRSAERRTLLRDGTNRFILADRSAPEARARRVGLQVFAPVGRDRASAGKSATYPPKDEAQAMVMRKTIGRTAVLTYIAVSPERRDRPSPRVQAQSPLHSPKTRPETGQCARALSLGWRVSSSVAGHRAHAPIGRYATMQPSSLKAHRPPMRPIIIRNSFQGASAGVTSPRSVQKPDPKPAPPKTSAHGKPRGGHAA